MAQIDDWEDVPVDEVDDWEDIPDGPSELESAARGFAQGIPGIGTYADEATGVVESLFTDKSYKQARDESRANYKAAEEANPASYYSGMAVPVIASSIPKAIPVLGTLASGVLGAIEGAGASENEDLSGILQDAGIAGGISAGTAGLGKLAMGGKFLNPFTKKVVHESGGLRALGNKLAPEASQALKELAEKSAVNATGATGKQAANFSDDAGRELLDRGIVKFGRSQDGIAKAAASHVEAAEKQIDKALKDLDARGIKVDANTIYNNVRQKINEMGANPSQADIANLLEKELDNLVNSTNVKGTTEFLASEAENIKRGYNRKAGNWADPEKSMAGKELYQQWRQGVEDVATKNAPETAKLFEEGKKSYGLLAPIQEAAERRASTTSQSPVGGFLDVASGAMGAASGGGLIGGVLAPIGRRIASPRISSSVAVGADKLADIVAKSPQSLGKYSDVLQKASQRGGNALGVTDYMLQMNDPEYREMKKQLDGE